MGFGPVSLLLYSFTVTAILGVAGATRVARQRVEERRCA
jgi:hypothetical protein